MYAPLNASKVFLVGSCDMTFFANRLAPFLSGERNLILVLFAFERVDDWLYVLLQTHDFAIALRLSL